VPSARDIYLTRVPERTVAAAAAVAVVAAVTVAARARGEFY